MGQMEKVLLIEADLRAPTLKRMFGIGGEAPGLVEVLTGQAKLEQALHRHEASGIHVLPVALTPANPSEVIASAAFMKLIDSLEGRFDRVVFDSPPVHAGSDSMLLANRMDAVIFVIHAGTTAMRAIQHAVKQLRAAQAPLLGHVLNNVDARSAYGLHYSYGYGYGPAKP
jgi:capsular exopolysaccharide synthesis family protein